MTRVGAWFLLLLLVTGCATPAVLYRHPTTGELSACSRRSAQASETSLGLMFSSGPLLSVVGYAVDGAAWAMDSATAGNRYADCKTALEQRGFVRDDP